MNFDDGVIPGYQRLAEGMHAEGALMMVQLAHASSAIGSHHSGSPMWAASPTFGEYGREVPHVMTTAEVEEVLHAFYEAASRVRRSGLDGVELSVFAGTLAQQMLSPVTNTRTDRFGGSPENRLRFLVELVKQTRSGLGDDRLVALKIAGDELYDAGLHLRDMQDIVRRLDREVAVDYYVVASGTNMEHFPRIDHWPPSPAPHGLRIGLASGIKEVTERPVAALARIVDPEMAEEFIARGECDLIAIVRATFADPEWVNKAAAGRLDDIRRCVGASSGCIDRIQLGEEAAASTTRSPVGSANGACCLARLFPGASPWSGAGRLASRLRGSPRSAVTTSRSSRRGTSLGARRSTSRRNRDEAS